MKRPLHSAIAPEDYELPIKHGSTPVVRPRVNSVELFGTAREVLIEHAGEEYRLRLTRQGKLILTK
jgi:hemin uptake protein HemP